MKKLILVVALIVGCGSPKIGEPLYKTGDLVYSHCGGPKMMVMYDVYGSDIVYVEWVDHLGHRHRETCSQTQISRASNE
jgi:uncharacterized protein YodC (DUF2158 family)